MSFLGATFGNSPLMALSLFLYVSDRDNTCGNCFRALRGSVASLLARSWLFADCFRLRCNICVVKCVLSVHFVGMAECRLATLKGVVQVDVCVAEES